MRHLVDNFYYIVSALISPAAVQFKEVLYFSGQ